MNSTGWIVVMLGVAVLMVALAKAMASPAARTLPLEAKPLMTARERETLRYLERAAPHARVHAQVSMGALLKVKKGVPRKEQMAARGRFSQKIVDFVLEDRASGKVIALVELDDRSHSPDKDARRDEITRAGGYLTIRLPAGEKPTEEIVRQRVVAGLEAAKDAERTDLRPTTREAA